MSGQAALCVIEREGKVLCVWNHRYQTWGLPGGGVEMGEQPEVAALRELEEEVGVRATTCDFITSGPSPHDFAWVLFAYRVTEYEGEPRAVEPDCPITWLPREHLLATSFFAPFLRQVFERVESGG
jgi:8-oxo-dGTP pyrophosphatase MutT (NUDIX family)